MCLYFPSRIAVAVGIDAPHDAIRATDIPLHGSAFQVTEAPVQESSVNGTGDAPSVSFGPAIRERRLQQRAQQDASATSEPCSAAMNRLRRPRAVRPLATSAPGSRCVPDFRGRPLPRLRNRAFSGSWRRGVGSTKCAGGRALAVRGGERSRTATVMTRCALRGHGSAEEAIAG